MGVSVTCNANTQPLSNVAAVLGSWVGFSQKQAVRQRCECKSLIGCTPRKAAGTGYSSMLAGRPWAPSCCGMRSASELLSFPAQEQGSWSTHPPTQWPWLRGYWGEVGSGINTPQFQPAACMKSSQEVSYRHAGRLLVLTAEWSDNTLVNLASPHPTPCHSSYRPIWGTVSVVI